VLGVAAGGVLHADWEEVHMVGLPFNTLR